MTFRGTVVPISKKAQLISKHPSIVKSKDGRIFQGDKDSLDVDIGGVLDQMDDTAPMRQPSTSEKVRQRDRNATLIDHLSESNEHTLFKMLHR